MRAHDDVRYMRRARGVLIVPNLVQGGFIIGAAGGRGVLMTRGDQGWSYPAFYGMGSGSIGLQIGAKVAEVLFIIRTDKGVQAILDSRYKFGAEAGLTVHAFPPATVKQQVTGFGRAEKAQVAFMVARMLELPGDGEAGDAADALAVALCHAHTLVAAGLPS